MAYYVIAGKPDCPSFVHVAHVCNYLKRHLPNFDFRKKQLPAGKWEYWLTTINTENDWHHTQSPIIWKEVARSGGKPTLIGGISDFWEYCYDYYGLESILPKNDLESLVADNKQFFDSEEGELETGDSSNYRIVTIMGFNNCYICPLLIKLLEVEGLAGKKGLRLQLFDLDADVEGRWNYLVDMMEGMLTLNSDVLLATTFQQALENCDLLLNIGDPSLEETEDKDVWYIRNTYSAHMLADNINAHAKRTLKVVFAGIGTSGCFNASILCQNCTRIKLSNVIAITADWGHGPLNLVAKECQIPLSELGAPPVWGIMGHNFVDIGSIIKKCDIRRPYARALRTNAGSTLPLGKISSELRYIKYLTDGIPHIWSKVNSSRELIQKRLGRFPSYSKLSATIIALRIWFSNKPCDDIISLGIVSNGCFGFPPGIVVSQPAIFNGKKWEPYKNFPMQDYAKKKVQEIITPINLLLEQFDIRKGSVLPTESFSSVVKRFSV